MNLKFSLIAIVTLILVGCGGGSDSPVVPSATLTKIETINQAKNSFQALGALNSLNQTNTSNTKSSKIFSLKTTSTQCDSGTVSLTETATTSVIVANNCTRGTVFMNGTFSESTLEDGSSKTEMSNLTVRTGTVELKTNKFVIVEKESEFWFTVDGDMKVVAKCFSGQYNFETREKIYDAQDGSDNVERGVLKLNGVMYTFDNPYVTIKIGNTERKILQSELETELTSGCSE